MTVTNPLPPDVPRETDLEQLGINVIRGLAMDAPRAANSGHPGTAMALAPLAHTLFTRVMRHDPSEPYWPDRGPHGPTARPRGSPARARPSRTGPTATGSPFPTGTPRSSCTRCST